LGTRTKGALAGVISVAPVLQYFVGCRSLDLLGIPLMIKGEHRLVSSIGRTANSVRHYDNPEAQVNGSENGCEHAHIGFAAGDHKGVDTTVIEMTVKIG
jgi:hypothetical protein